MFCLCEFPWDEGQTPKMRNELLYIMNVRGTSG